MADDDATTTVTFRRNHLVRLRRFNHVVLDGKLVRIKSNNDEATGKFEVAFLDDQARPPVPLVPARRMPIAPEHFIHACEFCLVVAPAADGGKLQMCGRCKTARYCNTECQRADWARHKVGDCYRFSHARGIDMLPLQQACKHGDIVEVRRLVEEGANIDKATTNGPTSLATAAVHGHLSVVQYLVECGADLDKARATSFTALYEAAYGGHLPIVRYLVERGADREKAAEDGTWPLLIAVFRGHFEVVQYLVEQGTDVDKARDDGATPLITAAQMGHLMVMQYLVEQGADKDKAGRDGSTPLLSAAQIGQLAIVRFLVEQGADIDKANDRGASPLLAAVLARNLEILRYLVEQGADKNKAVYDESLTPLGLAVQAGYTEVAAYLRAAGAR